MPEPIEEAASDCNALPSRDNADPPSPALNLKLSIVVRFRPSRKISLPSGSIIHSRDEGRRVGGLCFYPFRTSSGSLAILLAIRRASSLLCGRDLSVGSHLIFLGVWRESRD